ncbi:MAG: CbiX/SirB N-terminal domain-containing protein, partial [Pyrinomonadaceae bacterium]
MTTSMNVNPGLGIMIVGHGSRREEANADVREVARLIGLRGGYDLIEAAFLEIASPNIHEAYSRLVARGAHEIIVHPYFLSPGRHTRGDIPVEVAAAAQNYPNIKYAITEPLAGHSLVIEASIERIRQSTIKKSETFVMNFRARRGWVYLVGSGPGDPGLLTLKARDLLATCEVIVYDYLVNPDIVRFIAQRAECIYVGK